MTTPPTPRSDADEFGSASALRASDSAWVFEELLADPTEQFDARSELLASVLAFESASPASAGSRPRSRPGHLRLGPANPEVI